ncbi:MAG: IS66 family transposase [Sulfuricella sp.]
MGCHPNRGKKAFDTFGILTNYLGTLVHDGRKPYRELRCKHGLCNAHHLRELTYLIFLTMTFQGYPPQPRFL